MAPMVGSAADVMRTRETDQALALAEEAVALAREAELVVAQEAQLVVARGAQLVPARELELALALAEEAVLARQAKSAEQEPEAPATQVVA